MDTSLLPILIVEDDLGLNELLCDKVRELGYETMSCYTAGEALEWLKTHQALMLLLDFSLPDFTGKELIGLLNSNQIQIPPFIMATGRGDERIAVEMMKLGAKDYIIKDSSFLEMISVVIEKICLEIKNELKFKETQKALEELSLFNNQVINSAQEGIVVYDKDLNFVVWNPYMESMTGIKAEEMIGKKTAVFFSFLVENGVVDSIYRALNGETDLPEIELYFELTALNKAVWVADRTASLKNSDGEIIGVISSVRNITKRKIAEKALLESEARYKSLIEYSPDAIGIYVNGTIRFVNQQCLRLFKAKSAEELIGKNVFELVHTDSKALVAERMQKIHAEGVLLETVEEKFVRLDGSVVDVNVKAMSLKIGDELAVQLIARDITERLKAEREIAENRNGLREILLSATELIETTPDQIDYSKLCEVVKGISGAKYAVFNLFENDELEFRSVGFAGGEKIERLSKQFLGIDLLNHTWSADPIKAERCGANSISRFKSLADLCGSTLVKKVVDLVQLTFNLGEVCVVRISDQNTQLGDFTLLFEKDTTLRQPELVELFANQVGLYINRIMVNKEVIESEKKYRILFADNPQPMMIYDLDTLKYIEVNRAAIKHYGYTHEEFLAMSIEDIHPTEDLVGLLHEIGKIRKYQADVSDTEFRHKKKNGEIIYVQTISHSIKMDGHNARHVLFQDITERKKAEKDLQEKMDELIRFQRLTVDREHAMIDLKQEVNDLLAKLECEPKYKIVK